MLIMAYGIGAIFIAVLFVIF
jgi:hypothetical protein